jgi:hypothetical protein
MSLRNVTQALWDFTISESGQEEARDLMNGLRKRCSRWEGVPRGNEVLVNLDLMCAGGMGEVYWARDTRLIRDVAIKVLPPAFASDAGRSARFEQEARAAAALNYPNIVAANDIGVYDGGPYVVSELLKNRRGKCRSVSGGWQRSVLAVLYAWA